MKKTLIRSKAFQLTVFLSFVFLLFVGSFLYKNVYRKQHTENQQANFEQFLDNLFLHELEADPLSLHFMIKDASVYGISTVAPILPPHTAAAEDQYRQHLLAQKAALTSFSFEKLSPEQQQTYDCLLFLLNSGIALSDYTDLSNPFSPQRGIQQQLPLLLSEYRFDCREDMEAYLHLLDSVYTYFESLCAVLQDRIPKHTIPLVAIQNTARQCHDFLCTPPEENILLISFSERLSGLEYLDEIETAIYKMKNQYRVETEILPAYELLYETLSAYVSPQDSSDSLGLSAHNGGREYYTLLAQKAASSDMTVPEMKALLEQYYQESLARMKALARQNPDLPQQALNSVLPDGTSLYSAIDGSSSADTLRFLQQQSLQLLPSLRNVGDLHVTLKTTSPCLQSMSAPAMYLLSPYDAYLEHTVYVNPAYSGSSSYTTLAHETFPGHLTARVCFLSGKPHPMRALIDFIGWDEGWASFSELYALRFLTETDAVVEFLCCYEIASLCLYGLSDIGIHYDGWNKQDTLTFWSAHGVEEAIADHLWQLVVSEPAYYLPYSMGLVQMLELRKAAIASSGSTYTESAFCSALLSLGPMPYPVCEKYLLQTLHP